MTVTVLLSFFGFFRSITIKRLAVGERGDETGRLGCDPTDVKYEERRMTGPG
jgi:hypothetical protein